VKHKHDVGQPPPGPAQAPVEQIRPDVTSSTFTGAVHSVVDRHVQAAQSAVADIGPGGAAQCWSVMIFFRFG
jgi:hypothetical protein